MTDLIERKAPEVAPPSRRLSYGRLVAGLGLIAAGLLWFLERIDAITIGSPVIWAAALIFIGLALMVGSFERDHPGLVTIGVFVAIGALVTGLAAPDAFQGGLGDQRIRVNSMSELEDGYAVTAGKLTLDLTDLEVVGEASVETDVTFGELLVIVPPRTAVKVVAEAGAGEVIVLGTRYDGVGVQRTYTSPDFTGATNRLVLDASVLFGKLEVSR